MTGKYRPFARGIFSTSNNAAATGFGYIVMNPEWGVASDAPFVITNGPADTVTVVNPTAGTPVNNYSNSPYTQGLFQQSGLQYRIVGAGLRIRYAGALLTMGGQVAGLHHPAHTSLTGFSINNAASPLNNILSYKEAQQFSVTADRWTNVLYHAVEEDDTDYHITFPALTAGTGKAGYMGFAIQAPDTSGVTVQTFEWEAVAHVEILGAIVLNKTPSHVDFVGHGAVTTAANLSTGISQPNQIPSPDLARLLVSAAEHVVHYATSDPSLPPPPPPQPAGGGIWTSILGIAEKVLPFIGSAVMAMM